MINIKKKYLYISLAYLFISVLIYILLGKLNSYDYELWQLSTGLYIFLHLIVTFVCFKMMNIEVLSTSGIFVWLLYLFHFSQLFIKLISNSYLFNFDVSYIVSKETYIESIEYTFLILFSLTFGILLMKAIKKRNNLKNHKLSQLADKSYYVIGKRIFILTFPIEAYILIQRLFIASSDGYLAIYEIGTSGIMSLLGTFSLIGVIMMLLGSQTKKNRATVIFCLYTVFYLISMFSGGRMWQVIKILVVLYYYLKATNIKITIKNAFIVAVAGYFLAGFLSSIADFRGLGIGNIEAVTEVIKEAFVTSPLLNALEEFGGTIYTVALTVQKVPSSIDYSNGSQFLTSFISLLPNLSASIADINDKSSFVNLLDVKAIGGSFAAEMYYSFGYYAVGPTILIGMLIQWLTEKIELSLKTKNYHIIIYSIMLQYSIISWVRGSAIIFYRNVVFSFIFIYIISSLFVKRKNDYKKQAVPNLYVNKR